MLQSFFAFSQTQEILKVLNSELQKECIAQKQDPESILGIKFELVEEYSIKDSVLIMDAIEVDPITFKETATYKTQRAVKTLSLTVKKKEAYGDGFYTERQEVELTDITAVTKDINVIFETKPDAVKIIVTNSKGEQTTRTGDLFFTHLSYEKDNEALGKDLVKAFKQAGFTIVRTSWYD